MTEQEKLHWGLIGAQLIDKGYNCIFIGYEGSGDSGGIEYIAACKETAQEIIDESSYWERPGDELCAQLNDDDSKWIENQCYNRLDNIEDWWNNEGGYGTMVIDLHDSKYNIDNHVRYTHTEQHVHNGKVTE